MATLRIHAYCDPIGQIILVPQVWRSDTWRTLDGYFEDADSRFAGAGIIVDLAFAPPSVVPIGLIWSPPPIAALQRAARGVANLHAALRRFALREGTLTSLGRAANTFARIVRAKHVAAKLPGLDVTVSPGEAVALLEQWERTYRQEKINA